MACWLETKPFVQSLRRVVIGLSIEGYRVDILQAVAFDGIGQQSSANAQSLPAWMHRHPR